MYKKHLKILSVFMILVFFVVGSNGCDGCGGRDTVKPQVSITEPANGSTVSGIVTIKATATDNVGVAKAEFYIDGTKVGEDTTLPYEYSWDTTQENEGSQTITVKAIDLANNIGSASITVNVLIVWQKTFGGSDWDVAYSIQQTADGGYIAAGYTNSFGVGEADVYVLKLDANGNTGPYPGASRSNSSIFKLFKPSQKITSYHFHFLLRSNHL